VANIIKNLVSKEILAELNQSKAAEGNNL